MFLMSSDWQPYPRRPPAHTVMFAVGDIHGELDLLNGMRLALQHELASLSHVSSVIVFIGDYIDRGPSSIAVLEALSWAPTSGQANEIHLVGNHDQFLIETIGEEVIDVDFLRNWFDNGGLDTLESLEIPLLPRYLRSPATLRRALLAALKHSVREFLAGLKPYVELGDFAFVHAGIDPTLPLAENDLADLLLVREPFLSWPGPWPCPFTVVHGHTLSCPTVLSHRIGIDTGAHLTGALTAVQIEEGRLRFLTVSKAASLEWQSKLPSTWGCPVYRAPVPLV